MLAKCGAHAGRPIPLMSFCLAVPVATGALWVFSSRAVTSAEIILLAVGLVAAALLAPNSYRRRVWLKEIVVFRHRLGLLIIGKKDGTHSASENVQDLNGFRADAVLRKLERMMQGFRSVRGMQRLISIFQKSAISSYRCIKSAQPGHPYPSHCQ
jgi:hypothetical protein